MDTAFNTQIPITLAWEGGYSNNPNDAGGETNFGISKAAYPSLDIKNLDRDHAINIYYADYWLKPNIHLLPDFISGKVFDMGVNMGPKTAIKLLQQSTTSLAPDGIIGPKTATIISQLNLSLLGRYRFELVKHYLAIVTAKPSDAEFLDGWLRRACA
jgi:lysozyme family protein